MTILLGIVLAPLTIMLILMSYLQIFAGVRVENTVGERWLDWLGKHK